MILINLKKKGYHQYNFYSKLTDEDISEEDYKHAKNVWKKINVKQLGIIMIFKI